MFRGVTHINLDAKGRIAVPSRYRERLQALCEGELVMTIERDQCLLVYPLPEWETLEQKLSRLPSYKRVTRSLQRLLIGHATECQIDANGRILVPPPLRDYAGLQKKTVLIGQVNRFELWDEHEWMRRRDEWLAEAATTEDELPEELEGFSL